VLELHSLSWPPGGDSGCIEVSASCVEAAFSLLATRGRLLLRVDVPVALQLPAGGHGEQAVCSAVVGQRAGQQEAGEEPAEGVAVLLEEHQHAVHGLDAQGVT